MSGSREPVGIPQDWDVVFREFDDDSSASIFTNIALRNVAPIDGLPELVTVEILGKTDRGNGFPELDEFDMVFYPLEEALSEGLGEIDPLAQFAGRITSGATLVYFYYSSQVDTITSGGLLSRLFGSKQGGDPRLECISKIAKRWPTYDIKAEIKPDPQWETYRTFLAPDSDEIDQIFDRRVLSGLREHGDDPSVARDIDHFIICPDSAAQAEMVEIGQEMGFRATLSRTDAGGYAVELVRSDAPEDIAEIAAPLRDAAVRLRASYDGWGCPVAKG